jgi:hypothetical protein
VLCDLVRTCPTRSTPSSKSAHPTASSNRIVKSEPTASPYSPSLSMPSFTAATPSPLGRVVPLSASAASSTTYGHSHPLFYSLSTPLGSGNPYYTYPTHYYSSTPISPTVMFPSSSASGPSSSAPSSAANHDSPGDSTARSIPAVIASAGALGSVRPG